MAQLIENKESQSSVAISAIDDPRVRRGERAERTLAARPLASTLVLIDTAAD